jgi:hypothetical protein
MRGVIFCSLIIFLLLSHRTTFANRSTARFLLWQPSAASMAMGGIGVSHHFYGFASSSNPALLVHQSPLTVSGSYFKPFPFFQNIVHSFTSVGFQMPNIGFFSISYNMYWKAKQAFFDASGDYISPKMDEDISNYLFSWQAKISYGIAFKPNIFIGISLGYLRYNLWEADEMGVGAENQDGKTGGLSVDLGIQYVLLSQSALLKLHDIELPDFIRHLSRKDRNYGFTIGAALHNLGPSLSFIDDEQADPLPTKLVVGTSIPILTSNFVEFEIAVDAEKQIYEESKIDFIHSGSELTLYQLLKLRGGYVLDTFKPISSFSTWGIGIQTHYFSFFAARYKTTFLPTWHYDLNIFVEL